MCRDTKLETGVKNFAVQTLGLNVGLPSPACPVKNRSNDKKLSHGTHKVIYLLLEKETEFP
jgi:hypothetical protein